MRRGKAVPLLPLKTEEGVEARALQAEALRVGIPSSSKYTMYLGRNATKNY